MKIEAGLPAGVSALLFETASRRRRLERRLGERLEEAGYQEVLLPILDYFDPYAQLLGAAEKEQLYRFVDRDGHLLLLRSDFTPMLARVLAPRLGTLDLPLRCQYRGDIVRYQRIGPGQRREAAQLGAELYTAAGDEAGRAAADAELLGLFVDLVVSALGEGGGDPVVVVLGLSHAFDEVELDPAQKVRALAALARRDRREAKEIGDEWASIVATGLPRDPGWLGGRASSRLQELSRLRADLAARLDRRLIELRVDLAEFVGEGRTGGIDHSYYDGFVFRAFAPGIAPPIGTGGRYDRLLDELGAAAAAAGFSLSLDLLTDVRGKSRLRENTTTKEVFGPGGGRR